jgi:hypothetical protein
MWRWTLNGWRSVKRRPARLASVQAIYPKPLPAVARVVAKAPKIMEEISVLKLLIIVLQKLFCDTEALSTRQEVLP